MEMRIVPVQLPVVDGFEYTGEWRVPRQGEYYLPDVVIDGDRVIAHPCSGELVISIRHILVPVDRKHDWANGLLGGFKR